ncbi:MAG: hypothetical protein A2Z94_01735 [Gallionellales bacterium GWA2_55_18]|nr:MAG: hypothetical protein A2Z94_01735 [Gallionellales bacterium GWA2_55_18]
MRSPTLGYEDDTEISKSEIACEQLTEAITLFLQQKFLCAVTLAGAAEGIFAGVLNAHGEKAIVERSVEAIEKLREATGLEAMENLPANRIYKQWNTARNAIKHHDKNEECIVTINFFDEAYWMIKRALSNASNLGIPISNEIDFENWCILELHL